MKLISVIVTTYNWPPALKLCLESLFAQKVQDFEIIIADDGSNTENLKQTQTFCAQSPWLSLIAIMKIRALEPEPLETKQSHSVKVIICSLLMVIVF